MAGRPRAIKKTSVESGQNLTGSVQALERGLNLLAIIAEADGLSLTSIAQRAGIAPSTAHRILTTLKSSGFVQSDDTHAGYLIGVQSFRVGSAFLRNRKLVDVGRSTLRHLMQESGETANLAIEIEGSVVFISQMESHRAIRAFHRPGARGPMHASSLGKAMLAALSNHGVSQKLHRVGMPRLTARTIVDPDVLLADLALVRKRGWAIDDEEQSDGMRCTGSAIYNEYGEVIGAISVSGPTVRISDERLGELGPMVKRAAIEITERIGGRKPDDPC
ncbi:MAG: helix-turn-helix domain-containing protein [Xanthobacteraceae bacterium]|nr:helix-turn-helix domain-containing protein [Xanthobacteraceae bacterium]